MHIHMNIHRQMCSFRRSSWSSSTPWSRAPWPASRAPPNCRIGVVYYITLCYVILCFLMLYTIML